MAEIASIVFAAGKGTRMTGYNGNKTLLPLFPGASLFEGNRPLIREVLDNLPAGPKRIVINHCAAEVRAATRAPGVEYILQQQTNGTGGALLAARPFLESARPGFVIITMGDVPLIRQYTYRSLVERLGTCQMAVLAFEPKNRAQYGMLEIDGKKVVRIVEWCEWSSEKFPPQRREALQYCNAGVYAVKRAVLLNYMQKLLERSHVVRKTVDGREVTIREYFITDLVEMMNADGLQVGYEVASEEEVIGVDTPESLEIVQRLYSDMLTGGSK